MSRPVLVSSFLSSPCHLPELSLPAIPTGTCQQVLHSLLSPSTPLCVPVLPLPCAPDASCPRIPTRRNEGC